MNSCKVATMALTFPSNEKVRDALAGYLESLSKDNCPVPRGRRQGLCNLLRGFFSVLWNDDRIDGRESDALVTLVYKLMKSWPGYSGSNAYPVPAPAGWSGYTHPHLMAFESTPDLWVGHYGSDRKNLAAWMADQLKVMECRPVPKPTVKHGGVSQDVATWMDDQVKKEVAE